MICNSYYLYLVFYIILTVLIKYLTTRYNSLSCVIVRIKKPTRIQILRYQKWRKYFPYYFKFYLLSMEKMNCSLITNFDIINIVVLFDEIKMYYPYITRLKGNCSSYKSSRLLSWISHSESLILFYKKISMKYDYVWIIEQDVGFLGNIFNFIKHFNNNDKDLITIGVGKVTSKWVWFNCATEQYINRRNYFFKYSYGYSNREYIQRWSRLYFTKLMLDLQNNFHSQSETSTIELVFYHNLSYGLIPNRFIGSPLYAGRSITKLRWKNISHYKGNFNKFYHPLKF